MLILNILVLEKPLRKLKCVGLLVPIANYNEKDKSFVYQEEGMAVFKLYAVHSGHQPGPLDGNARIMHRVVGHKGGYLMDHDDVVYGVNEEMENDGFGLMGKDEGDLQFSVLQQVRELKAEVGMLEGKVSKIPPELLGSVSRRGLRREEGVRWIIVEGLRNEEERRVMGYHSVMPCWLPR